MLFLGLLQFLFIMSIAYIPENRLPGSFIYAYADGMNQIADLFEEAFGEKTDKELF